MPNKRGGEQSTTRPGSRDRPAKHIFAHILLIDDEPAWDGRSFTVTVAHALAGFDIGAALIHVPNNGWVPDYGVRVGQSRRPPNNINTQQVFLSLVPPTRLQGMTAT